MKNFIKEATRLAKVSSAEYKEQRIFHLLDGTIAYVDADNCNNMDYFCDDEGIKYGNEHFSHTIVPKNVFIEAINKWQ